MKIRMYDMKFGDCFLLQEKSEYFLVDFGSDSNSNLQATADHIASTCNGRALSALLTHFHKDHINGFYETDLSTHVKFQRIYMPNIVAMNDTRCRINYLQLLILRDIFEAVVLKKGFPQITLYQLLKKLMNTRSRVEFLQRGNYFSFAGEEYDVLWPCFDMMRIHGKTVTGMVKIAGWLGFISGYDAEQLGYLRSQDQWHIRFHLVDNFIEKLVYAYIRLSQGEPPSDDIMIALEHEYTAIMNQTNRSKRILTPSQEREIKSTIQSMIKEGNRISIVFQDRGSNNCSQLLMTGDVTSTDLKKILEDKIADGLRINRFFDVIKLSHHGTSSHYLPDLPECKTLLASNGDGNPQRGKIAYEYGGFYVYNRRCQMVCINERCELLDISHRVNAQICSNCAYNADSKHLNGDLYIEITT